MTTPGTILFFSDAHLGSHGPAQEELKIRRFVSLLQHARRSGAEVFFLGDLFDFWFEYKHYIPKTSVAVLAAIREFTAAGGDFHLLVGNHDFWMADYFERELGALVHRGDLPVVRQGLRLYLSHGDGKAPSEHGYRMMRAVLRFRPHILLFRLLPADWAYALARFCSGRSRHLNARRPPSAFARYDQVAGDILGSGFDAVVMGHLHSAWVRRLDGGWWANSGDFFENFTYLILENGEFRMATWNPETPTDGETATGIPAPDESPSS